MTNEKRTTKKAKVAKDGAAKQAGGGLPRLHWINVYFNEQDLEELLDTVETLNVVVCSFILGLPEEYDLSAKFDARSGRWAARVICTGADHENADCAVTVRAATRLDAIYALAFAIDRKLPALWRESDDEPLARFG